VPRLSESLELGLGTADRHERRDDGRDVRGVLGRKRDDHDDVRSEAPERGAEVL
jgi:hypothetical protein